MQAAFHLPFSGAIPVQKGFLSIENIENIEIETPIYRGTRVFYPHIWGRGLNFESVGCAFESHRGCLYVGDRFFRIREHR